MRAANTSMGAVMATKLLRDRSQPLLQRVELANSLLDPKSTTVLPRKQTVILEWIFDMLAIDSVASGSIEIWQLLLRSWPITPEEGRLRVFKNHKFVTNVISALQAGNPELVELVVSCIKSLSTVGQVLHYGPNQASQLLLAYCAHAVNNEELSELIFDSLKPRVRILSISKTPEWELDLILREANAERRHFYLKDLFMNPGLIVPSAADNVSSVVAAMCDAEVELADRIKKIAATYPATIAEIVNVVNEKCSRILNAELVTELLTLSFQTPSINWELVDQCLHLNAVPLLDPKNMFLKRILEDDVPEEILASIVTKLAEQRQFVEFLQTWQPDLPLPFLIQQAFSSAISSLSAVQLTQVLDTSSVDLVVQSLSYQQATAISEALKKLYIEDETSDDLKIAILNVLPSMDIGKLSKKGNPYVVLRSVELDTSKVSDSLVSSVAKLFDSDSETNSFLIMRYFPLMEKYLDEHQLVKILKRSSADVRFQLAGNHDVLECVNLTKSLVEVAIAKKELSVLRLIPHTVFTWDQRHEAVEMLIAQVDKYAFEVVVLEVCRLFDVRNRPSSENLCKLISRAQPNQAQLLLNIVRLVRKDAACNAELLTSNSLSQWQKACISCINGKLDQASEWLNTNYGQTEFIEPVLCILRVMEDLPQASQITKTLALKYGSTSSVLPRSLFQLLCAQKHSIYAVSAFYVFSECAFEDDYVEYLKSVETEELHKLLYYAAHELEFGILKSLVFKMEGYSHVVTAIIAKSVLANQCNTQFWEFCDVVLREKPALITQFSLELIIERLSVANAETEELWRVMCLITSRILLYKRNALQRRLHLAIAALTNLLQLVKSPARATSFAKLVANLCNPPQITTRGGIDLTSQVARERRHVAKHAGVLLQNIILMILANSNTNLRWSETNTLLRGASLMLVDLTYGDGLKAVSAGMDSASRAYLRSVFDDYKVNGRWSSD